MQGVNVRFECHCRPGSNTSNVNEPHQIFVLLKHCLLQWLVCMLFYHGSEGLKNISLQIHSYTYALANLITSLGYKQLNRNYFDTLNIELPLTISIKELEAIALQKEINFRYIDQDHVGISLDETTNLKDLNDIAFVFCRSCR